MLHRQKKKSGSLGVVGLPPCFFLCLCLSDGLSMSSRKESNGIQVKNLGNAGDRPIPNPVRTFQEGFAKYRKSLATNSVSHKSPDGISAPIRNVCDQLTACGPV